MIRERIVEVAIATILAVALSTELLSAFHAINRISVTLLWLLIAALSIAALRKTRWAWKWDWAVGVISVTAGAIWAVEGIAAILSPPNSSDAMAYHMPRVIYWIQQRSVEFFATPYLNQIMLQPLHEYITMHLQLLSGSDRFANCVAWLSTGGYIVGASLLAKALGAGGRGQALAALLAATLPNGILQATGAKNEALLSFLLVSMVYFALSQRRWMVAVACGLACFTKATAFIFAAPLLILLIPHALPHVALAVLLINGPFFWRNIDLSGSPLGFDSAQADGNFRWRNEYLGWQPMTSNLIRHLSEQLGDRNESWNQGVYRFALDAHSALGLNPDDPATTWPDTGFLAPRSANHETDTNNRWHLLLILTAAIPLARSRDKRPLLILGALAAGGLAFCFYLKWQPFMLRMWLPLFAAGVGIAAVALARRHWMIQIAISVFLLGAVRLPLLKSWIRPLAGPESVFVVSREELYYNDMKTYKVRKQFNEVMKGIKASPCREIAMDINQFQLEYPILALTLRDHPETRFVHVNTVNPSRKYDNRMTSIRPCVLVCLACDKWLDSPQTPR